MSLYSIKTNLENTIYGKEKFLVNIQSEEFTEPESKFALDVMIQVLKINIKELKDILVDVNSTISEQSWGIDQNSDQRMGYWY